MVSPFKLLFESLVLLVPPLNPLLQLGLSMISVMPVVSDFRKKEKRRKGWSVNRKIEYRKVSGQNTKMDSESWERWSKDKPLFLIFIRFSFVSSL